MADICDLEDNTAFEVEMTPNPENVYLNIRKDLEVGFTKVVIVVKDGKARNALERGLRDCLDPWDLERIEVRPIKEFLT